MDEDDLRIGNALDLVVRVRQLSGNRGFLYSTNELVLLAILTKLDALERTFLTPYYTKDAPRLIPED